MKDNILMRGYPKKRRSEPGTTVAIDNEVAYDVELHNRFYLLTQLLSGDDCNDDDDKSECSDDSVCSNDSGSDVSNGSERSRRRRKPRENRKPKQSEPHDRSKAQGTTPKCDGVTLSMPQDASNLRSNECLL